MTQAICYHCGEFKDGAFVRCDVCHAEPKTEEQLVDSLAMTERYFDHATLERIGATIRERGAPPELDPENRQKLLGLIRAAGETLPLQRFGTEATTKRKKFWWKVW